MSNLANVLRRAYGAVAEPGRSLLIVISAVHLSVAQFIRGTLPGSDFLVIPNQVFLILIVVLLVIPTAAAFLCGRLIRHLRGERALAAYHAALMIVTVILVLHQVGLYLPRVRIYVDEAHNDWPVAAASGSVLLLAIAGLLVLRFRGLVEELMVWFAPAAVLITFMLAGWHSAQNGAYEGFSSDAVEGSGTSDTPVFVIVFDEFSYDALLDEAGRIDGQRFPQLARFAEDSVTFDRATANFYHTWLAVPPMVDSAIQLTELYDVALYLQMHRVAKLYAPGCGAKYTCRGMRYISLLDSQELAKDQALRALARAVPEWFLRASGDTALGIFRSLDVIPASADPASVHGIHEEMLEGFLEDIGEASRGRVSFLRTLLPHQPHIFGPDGTLQSHGHGWHVARAAANPNEHGAAVGWSEDYTQQIGYAGAFIGEFVATLKREGLYEDAVIVVTADHGWRTDLSGSTTPVKLKRITARVPLFIKAPGLPAGTVSSVDYQHVDFGATLYDLLNEEVPNLRNPEAGDDNTAFGFGPGVSAFATERPERNKVFYVDVPDGEIYWRYEFDEAFLRWELVETFNEPVPDRTRPRGDG